MCQYRPAWERASRRIEQYQAAFTVLAEELQAGTRTWRSALDECERLYSAACQDRLCVEKSPDAPAAVLCQCEDTWPAIRGAFDACEAQIEAVQRGRSYTYTGKVYLIDRAEFADVPEPPSRGEYANGFQVA